MHKKYEQNNMDANRVDKAKGEVVNITLGHARVITPLSLGIKYVQNAEQAASMTCLGEPLLPRLACPPPLSERRLASPPHFISPAPGPAPGPTVSPRDVTKTTMEIDKALCSERRASNEAGGAVRCPPGDRPPAAAEIGLSAAPASPHQLDPPMIHFRASTRGGPIHAM